ncbi:MAG TPA: DUF3147 family protein [Acidobacteriaceae bacterium]|jgi:hypothetical protein|nr:DUF3147 family protein [Acidobacteriaceae bacterium]
MTDLLIRFLVGGFVVSLFAVLGDLLRPKSFAGLFGAAPSVALATVGLTVLKEGKAYAAWEARSMLAGAAAFLVYAALASFVFRRYKLSALATTVALMPVWFGVSFGLWLVLFGRPA